LTPARIGSRRNVNGFYKEFFGKEEDEEKATPSGRVVFFATMGSAKLLIWKSTAPSPKSFSTDFRESDKEATSRTALSR